MICVAVPPGPRERDVAQFVRVEILLLCLDVVFARALLHADLAHAVVLTGRFDNQRSFIDRSGKRLLDIDVTAGVQRVNRDRRVPVIRSRAYHRVNVKLFRL